jgi:hypothetical protein
VVILLVVVVEEMLNLLEAHLHQVVWVEVEEDNLEIVAHHHYQELQIVAEVAEVLVLVLVVAQEVQE